MSHIPLYYDKYCILYSYLTYKLVLTYGIAQKLQKDFVTIK